MLALVKKPHIELSIHGEQTEELISWIRKKYEVTVLSNNSYEDSSEFIPIEETDFWNEMQSNKNGNLLVAARLKDGLTQKQLAEAVGIRQSMISEYENGKRRLTREMAQKISLALNIDPARFE